MSEEQTFRNGSLVQNVQPLRSVQPPASRGSVQNVLNGLNDLNDLNGSEATRDVFNRVPNTMHVGVTLYSCVRSLRGLLLANYTLSWLFLMHE
jgi:hypothetical protein